MSPSGFNDIAADDNFRHTEKPEYEYQKLETRKSLHRFDISNTSTRIETSRTGIMQEGPLSQSEGFSKGPHTNRRAEESNRKAPGPSVERASMRSPESRQQSLVMFFLNFRQLAIIKHEKWIGARTARRRLKFGHNVVHDATTRVCEGQ
jgi:hypothetical protein